MSSSTAEQPGFSFYHIQLPEAPAELRGSVKAWQQEIEILTYAPQAPQRNPMFLEKRVYQGSSGKVYPLPVIDRIATEPTPKMWKAIHIENEYIRLMILPEIGGRIHIGYDKITGYDFFYRQNVIKPALVGLAGPWISGGVEFNWPQHHRPATFMPVTTEIESGNDGSVTVWCSDHDPMLRMKGMHGVSLHPHRAVLELKVRLYNRTPFTQTFLWWANVATRVHEKYQSFFPPDVSYVADHAKRAITSFPQSNGSYYGVNYGDRAEHGVPVDEEPSMYVPDKSYAPNDLSWYANIPVPTSYMVTGTEQDFCGGYDHKAGAGVVHVANHHIAPGKKQWTWGNHDFGYAWDRNLTDNDGPYIELMSGVYTDNQPDFSYLSPWETKTFMQNWYPIASIGTPVAANVDAALNITQERIGVCVTAPVGSITVVLERGGDEVARWTRDIEVGKPAFIDLDRASATDLANVKLVVRSGLRILIEYDPTMRKPAVPPPVAIEPRRPEEIESIEDLYLTGLHLEQYRHATRGPEPYWREGLRRDPSESRIRNALGLWLLRRGEFDSAAEHFQAAIERLTRLNPNPRDGEAYYNLGLTRRYQGQFKQAYDAFYKAAWNALWRAPGFFALAECDATTRDWGSARDHVQLALRADADNLNARNLLAIVLRKLGNTTAAEHEVNETLALDPLDVGARWQTGIGPANGQEYLDLAFDLIRAGLYDEALAALDAADPAAQDGSAPMILYTLAYVQDKLGLNECAQTLDRACSIGVDYCFPSRLEEMLILQWALSRTSEHWSPAYLLGNLLYDKRRYDEAIKSWEKAAEGNRANATIHRNLAFAYYNVRRDPGLALRSFEVAFSVNPDDSRVLYERDQLWKRTGRSPKERLHQLLKYRTLVDKRDDLSLELATLMSQVGRPNDALAVLLRRRFQPWEGGEGLALGQYVRARILLGLDLLERREPANALDQFLSALDTPRNIGEAKHLLVNQSNVHYWIGEAFARSGDDAESSAWWVRASRQKGDFQQMSVQDVSAMTFWSGLALQSLGRNEEAAALFRMILEYSVELENTEPAIDYFATSLPTMLLFDEDLRKRNRIDAGFLRAQAQIGLGLRTESEKTLHEVMASDGNHTDASDLLRQLGQIGGKGRCGGDEQS